MKFISPMLAEGIDHIVLGCTHYPFFTPLLKELLPQHVTIVNPAPAVAQQAVRILEQMGEPKQISEPSIEFYASDKIDVLRRLAEEIEEPNISFRRHTFIGNIKLSDN
jgi:glutamate racemase